MNIFYEEGGKFKAAAVIQKSDATYQAQTQHGKRAKIKAANVFAEFDGDMADFLERAQEEATQIDTDLLWESCGGDEFTAEHAAAEYFGAGYGKVQLAATLMALYACLRLRRPTFCSRRWPPSSAKSSRRHRLPLGRKSCRKACCLRAWPPS